MGGRALVEGDEFVDLGAVEAALAAEQGVEAVPLGTMGGHEDIEVHRVCCSSSLCIPRVDLSY